MNTEEDDYANLQRKTENGELIWHYTDWAGMRGIVDSEEVWATHFTHLNDTGELTHALGLTTDCFSEQMSHVQLKIAEFLRSAEDTPPVYITSFSKAFDSLEQWRAYSGGSIGFALGFDATHLQEISDCYNFKLVPCGYSDQDARDRAKQFASDWHEKRRQLDLVDTDPSLNDQQRTGRHKAWSATQRSLMGDLVAAMVPFKHKCFVYEQEVRLISPVIVPGIDFRRMPSEIKADFRLQGREVIRFLKMPLHLPQYHPNNTSVQAPKTPLRAIVFGPMKGGEQAVHEVREYAKSIDGNAVYVSRSQLPIRSK